MPTTPTKAEPQPPPTSSKQQDHHPHHQHHDPDPSTQTILITGINGYIASHIGLLLLQKRYKVRGTSRSASSKDHLLTGAFLGHESQYTHYHVPDITAPGAFDAAVQGVHGIIHVASPVDFTLTTVDEYIGPAVGGNLSILDSASRRAGPQLRSFVVTSSVAAIVDKWKQAPDHAYTESDWNTTGESVARTTFTAPVSYGASKAVAERALWTWVSAHKPPFAVSAINPAVVTGPPVSWPETPQKLNTTLLPVWNLYAGNGEVMPAQIGPAGWIDVRDVARMHVFCVENPEVVDRERFLLVGGKAPPQAIADILRREFPERGILTGEPGAGYRKGDYGFVEGEASLESGKALKAMGVDRFIGFERSILDTVEALERRWPGLAQKFTVKN